MGLRPDFRIKVKITGKHQEVELSHSAEQDSSDEYLLKAKASYYLRNWERMGRPDPRTLSASMAIGSSKGAAVDREESRDVLSLTSRTPDGASRVDVIQMNVFRAHPEVLDGIEIVAPDRSAITVLPIPFSNTGGLLQIAAKHPGFLPALHEKLVRARDQWRLKQLIGEKTRALDEAVSQVKALLVGPSVPDQS